MGLRIHQLGQNIPQSSSLGKEALVFTGGVRQNRCGLATLCLQRTRHCDASAGIHVTSIGDQNQGTPGNRPQPDLQIGT